MVASSEIGPALAIPGFPRYMLHRLGHNEWAIVGPSGKRLAVRPGNIDGRPTLTLIDSLGRYMATQLGRVVLLAHAGEPPAPGMICCHNDGNPFNNEPDNVRWGTYSDNAKDAVKHGTAVNFEAGERHPNAKLTNAQMAAIRAEYVPGHRGSGCHPGSRSWLAKKYGVSPTGIAAVIKRGGNR